MAHNLNFLPANHLDTGGGNYTLLKNFSDAHLLTFANGRVERVSNEPSGELQYIHNIVHFVQSRAKDAASRAYLAKKKALVRDAVRTHM